MATSTHGTTTNAAPDGTDVPSFTPVVVGGDIGSYALAREIHEAYGLTSVCLVPIPIAAIKHSKIMEHREIPSIEAHDLRAGLERIAAEDPGRKVLVLTNSEPVIAAYNEVKDQLPANVVAPIPSAEVVDLVSHKDSFARLCAQNGLDTPRQEVVELAGSDAIAPTELPFPVVAKPAYSPEYSHFINVLGFQKVYFMERQEQLDRLWKDLREAGFAGTFLVQELIGGDDTYMDSVTIYVASDGTPTLFSGANVLLEDHSPAMLGNPVAMITTSMREVWEKSARMLSQVGYRGYANFDVKRDPTDGRKVFLEVNPRIGRNSYYVAAAGENPMRHCVEDLVLGRPRELAYVEREILYTLVPLGLLRHYIRDERLLARTNRLIDAHLVFDPQRYDHDRGLRRMLAVETTEQNQRRKFAQYYPDATDSSF